MHCNYLSKDIIGWHNWRQSQTMWNVRNFTRADSNILNPRVSHFNTQSKDNILRYEFPLMQWGMGMIQRTLGESVMIIRLLSFILTIIGLIFLYKTLIILGIGKMTSAITSVFYLFSPIIYHFSFCPIPDNLALATGIGYIYYAIKYERQKKIISLFLAGLLLGISAGSKLPFLMFSIVSVCFIGIDVIKGRSVKKRLLESLILFITLLPILIWYAWVMPSWKGNGILNGIFDNHLELNDYFSIIGYHISTMFPLRLLTPNVILFFVLGMYTIMKSNNYYWYYGLVLITFLYLVLQLNMIGKNHDYYMMPFLPWIYISVAKGVDSMLLGIKNWHKYFVWIMLLLSPLVSFWICKDSLSIQKSFFNSDLYICQSKLKTIVPNNERCIILNDNSKYIFSYAIDKMGFIFDSDELPVAYIEDIIKTHKVKYLYSDSRKVENQKDFDDYINKIIFECGTIKVFKLKELY